MEIAQYHSHVPNWRRTTAAKVGELFGIELEVEHDYDRQVAADALDNFNAGLYHAPIVERDGSLDPGRGLEVICPPLPREDVMGADGYIARLMHSLRESGVSVNQRDGCGMHVNINVVEWTPQEKLLVQWCLNAFTLTAEEVGRRGAGRTFGTFRPVCVYQRAAGGEVSLNTYPGSKHCAAWLRPSAANHPRGRGDALVMEVRFPKSTLEIKDLHAAIDYVTAVRDWVRVAPNHTQALILLASHAGVSVAVEALFMRWCLKNRPGVISTPTREQVAQMEEMLGRGPRLAVIKRLYEQTNEVRAFTGFRHQEPGDKEQILRISTLISKGARLEGEQAVDFDGRAVIDPASVRAGR